MAEIGADNLTGLLFAEEQGSFLAGVAAALKTDDRPHRFRRRRRDPADREVRGRASSPVPRRSSPTSTIDSSYLTPAGDFSGFNDPAKGQIAAQGMFDAGADIVYHAAGGSGLGVFQAAAASDKRAIGVDSDQYKTVDDPALQAVIMTSMLKRVDNAVENFIDDVRRRQRRGRHGRRQRPRDRRCRPGQHRRVHRRHPGPDRRLPPADHRR